MRGEARLGAVCVTGFKWTATRAIRRARHQTVPRGAVLSAHVWQLDEGQLADGARMAEHGQYEERLRYKVGRQPVHPEHPARGRSYAEKDTSL